MRIVYRPFVDHIVKLAAVEPPNLEGQVVLRGAINNKGATLTLELDEALRIYRDLKQMGIEELAKAYGVR